MPRIPETIIDQVRLSIDIVDVVGDHVALTRRGKSFVGLCPFHDDSTPSLNVSQEKQIYKCFACGAGGNSFTFLRDIENISFIEAVRQLADRAGIALPDAKPADPDQQEVFDHSTAPMNSRSNIFTTCSHRTRKPPMQWPTSKIEA